MYQMRQKTELKSTVQKNQSMFIFLDNIIKFQATTYIKFRSTSTTDTVRSRHYSEKETVVLEKYRKFERGELSHRDYVCILSYTFQPLI